MFVKRDHYTALRAVQEPSMTPTQFLVMSGGRFGGVFTTELDQHSYEQV